MDTHGINYYHIFETEGVIGEEIKDWYFLWMMIASCLRTISVSFNRKFLPRLHENDRNRRNLHF